MSASTAPQQVQPPPEDWQPPTRKPRRRGLRITVAVIGGLALLGLGIGIGSAAKSTPAAIVHTRTVTKTVTVKVPGPTITKIVTRTITVKPKAAAPAPAPAAAPKPTIIATFTGSGIQNTTSFTTPATWHLSWYYNCSNFGQSGNFQVYEYNTDGSLDLAGGVMVNELGMGKGPVATQVYGDAGQHYLSVNSECNWQVVAVAG